MSKFRTGDTAYVFDHKWIKVRIINVDGNYYHVRQIDRSVAFGVQEHRLLSEEEYLSTEGKKVHTNFAPPWLH